MDAADVDPGVPDPQPHTMDKNTQSPSAEIRGNTLVITMPLSEPTPSASGKSLVVATTRGNLRTTATVNGKPITIGVNAYIPTR